MAFAVFWVAADEGSLPPMSRLPKLPSGATIVAEDQECGSGGCQRKITVQPAPGQSPDDLARSLRLTGELSLRPTFLDPAFVSIGSYPSDGRLIITFGYSGGFK